jgi:hypothetical protein
MTLSAPISYMAPKPSTRAPAFMPPLSERKIIGGQGPGGMIVADEGSPPPAYFIRFSHAKRRSVERFGVTRTRSWIWRA